MIRKLKGFQVLEAFCCNEESKYYSYKISRMKKNGNNISFFNENCNIQYEFDIKDFFNSLSSVITSWNYPLTVSLCTDKTIIIYSDEYIEDFDFSIEILRNENDFSLFVFNQDDSISFNVKKEICEDFINKLEIEDSGYINASGKRSICIEEEKGLSHLADNMKNRQIHIDSPALLSELVKNKTRFNESKIYFEDTKNNLTPDNESFVFDGVDLTDCLIFTEPNNTADIIIRDSIVTNTCFRGYNGYYHFENINKLDANFEHSELCYINLNNVKVSADKLTYLVHTEAFNELIDEMLISGDKLKIVDQYKFTSFKEEEYCLDSFENTVDNIEKLMKVIELEKNIKDKLDSSEPIDNLEASFLFYNKEHNILEYDTSRVVVNSFASKDLKVEVVNKLLSPYGNQFIGKMKECPIDIFESDYFSKEYIHIDYLVGNIKEQINHKYNLDRNLIELNYIDSNDEDGHLLKIIPHLSNQLLETKKGTILFSTDIPSKYKVLNQKLYDKFYAEGFIQKV
tara:strand:- start:17153 stop:18691 length:1539 start_codon:yes stop_codon:yes gene_type:complete